MMNRVLALCVFLVAVAARASAFLTPVHSNHKQPATSGALHMKFMKVRTRHGWCPNFLRTGEENLLCLILQHACFSHCVLGQSTHRTLALKNRAGCPTLAKRVTRKGLPQARKKPTHRQRRPRKPNLSRKSNIIERAALLSSKTFDSIPISRIFRNDNSYDHVSFTYI